MKKLAMMLLAINLAGCASYFTRKTCESTNWFQHGQDVAMSGNNLENDDFLNKCRKVEADIDEAGLDRGFKKGRDNYCEPSTAFATGKKGEPFAGDMCDGGNIAILRKRHADGIKEFCSADNGEAAGATGKPYKNVCPKGMEGAFLKEFNKGRKRFLNAEVESRQQQVDDMDRDIRDLQDQRSRKSSEMASISDTKVIRSARTYEGFGHTRTTTDQVTTVDDPSAKQRRDSIQREIDDLDWQIRSKRQNQDQVRDEIRKLRSEMMSL